MSIYEEKVKINHEESKKKLSECNFDECITKDSESKNDLNEEIIVTSNEENLVKDEEKMNIKDEVIIKNPREKKDKKAIEYIEDDDYSNKPWGITLILCILLGFIGFHRFYVGKAGTAILMLLTFGGFGIWVLVDLIRIIINNFTDEEGKVIKRVSLAS